jgi:hypothetical protein
VNTVSARRVFSNRRDDRAIDRVPRAEVTIMDEIFIAEVGPITMKRVGKQWVVANSKVTARGDTIPEALDNLIREIKIRSN